MYCYGIIVMLLVGFFFTYSEFFLVLSAKLSCVLITISQNSKQNDIKMYKVISLMLSSSNHLYSVVVMIVDLQLPMQSIITNIMSSNPAHGEVYSFDARLCDEVCQWLWFSPGSPVSNKSDCHDIDEILLKMVLNTIPLLLQSKLDLYIVTYIQLLRHKKIFL
jgi:hypothetical protein